MKNAIVIIILVAFTSCGVELKNHTPQEFPYDIYSGSRINSDGEYITDQNPEIILPSGDITYPYNLITKNEELPKHTFYLSTDPQSASVSVKKAYIILDNEEYEMERYPEESSIFWKFNSPDECRESYSYYFKVIYESGTGGDKEVTLKNSEDNNFIANVLDFGSATRSSNFHKRGQFDGDTYSREIPISDGSSLVYNGEDIIYISLWQGNNGLNEYVTKEQESPRIYSRTIKIQNLSNAQFTIERVRPLENMPGEFARPGAIFNADEFELSILNGVTPVILSCGDYLYIKIKWHAEENHDRFNDLPYEVDYAFIIEKHFVADGTSMPKEFDSVIIVHARNSIDNL